MIRLIVFLIGMWIGYGLGRQKPTPAVKRAPSSPTIKSPAVPDDLTEIDGIGLTFAQALNNIGIRTFAQLAAQNPDDLAQRLAVRVTADRIRRDGWIEQARAKSGNG
jgi:predicted flap endonuclease-1-like 5' DNA nuclease